MLDRIAAPHLEHAVYAAGSFDFLHPTSLLILCDRYLILCFRTYRLPHAVLH